MFRHNRTKIMEREIKNLKEERQFLEYGLKKIEARCIDLQGEHRHMLSKIRYLETMVASHMGAPFSAPNSELTEEMPEHDDEYKGLSSVAHKLAGKDV